MSWRALRAALLLVVLVLEGILALPIPEVLTTRLLSGPSLKLEVEAWVEMLEDVGIETTREALASRIVAVAAPPIRARNAVKKALEPWSDRTGTGQGWGFFAYPDRYPQTLVIEAERSGAWTEIHRALVDEHEALGPVLRYRRIRGVYTDSGARSTPGPLWIRFVDWVAAEVFALDPTVTAVRVSMERKRLAIPGEDERPATRRMTELRTR